MSEEIQKKKEEMKQVYDLQQKAAWDTVESFHNTAKIDTAMGAKYSEYDDKDMFALRDALFLDEDSKDASFELMYTAVNNLLSLSVSKGKFITEDGKTLNRDFFETFFTAKSSIGQYLFTHSGFRWQAKGDRRVQIALRLQKILNNLSEEITRVQGNLPQKEARMVDYAKEGLTEEEIEEREAEYQEEKNASDIMKIAETGEFGPKLDKKAAKKAQETWVVKGYTDALKDVLKGKTEDKNEFLSFVIDENNRLLANRMAISILVEDDKKTTFNMPWLQDELKKYVADKLGDEGMLSKTTEIPAKIKDAIGQFKTENEARLKKIDERRTKLTKTLSLSRNIPDFYDYPVTKELFMEIDDDEFEERLESLKERVEETDKSIRRYLKDNYSIVSRDHITNKLILNLGALRVFGSTEQVMDQTELFCDMLKYTDPEAYLAEKTLKNVMKELRIDSVRRDHFVRSITENAPEKILNFNIYEIWELRGEDYAKKVAANTKSYIKRVDVKGRSLSMKQWDALEKLNLSSGRYKNAEFKEKVEAIINEDNSEYKISRNEYLSKRKFRDAQKDPVRIKKAKAEQALIDKMGDSMDIKFLVHMNGDMSGIYEPYRELDAAYKGNEKRLKARREEAERLYKERKYDIKRVLQRGNIPTTKREQYLKRFKWIMSGIKEITDEMTDDERLTIERINLERFGVRNWQAAIEKLDEHAEDLGSGKELEDVVKAQSQYEAGCETLKNFSNGEYADYVDFLTNIPEIYAAMMHKSEEEFKAFLGSSVEPKLRPFMEGLKLAGLQRDDSKKKGDQYYIPTAVRKQYAYSYLRSIYDGRLSGDATFFSQQLTDYNQKIFAIKPDGKNSIADNIKDIEKAVDKKLKSEGHKGAYALSCKIAVLAKIYDMANDTEEFLRLFDGKKLTAHSMTLLADIEASAKEDEKIDEVKKKIVEEFEDKLKETDPAVRETVRDMEKTKQKGAVLRAGFLGVDEYKTERIRLGKSLVRVAENNRRRVNLNTSKADSMRGRIQKYCGDLNLPPVLHDALVEEGANESIKGRLDGLMFDNDMLQNHAFAMNKLYTLLMRDQTEDPAMSSEEAQMFIVRLYSNKVNRNLFEKPAGPDVASLRKQAGYKAFRENYRKLKEIEAIEYDDPFLESEGLEMAKNLRVLLVTNVGLLDKNGKTIDATQLKTPKLRSDFVKSVGNVIDRNKVYLERSAKLSEIIKAAVVLDDAISGTAQETSEKYKQSKCRAIRQYFMKDLIEELNDKKAFDEDAWREKVEAFHEDKTKWDNVLLDRNTISNTSYKTALGQKVESTFDETFISKAIKDNVILFKGRVNKYEKLDEDEKKFFALGLMLMDKGSIGYGTEGTMALCSSMEAKDRQLDKIKAELDKYVKGEDYNLDINYKDAFNKLVNYGETGFFFMNGYTLSVTAYEKALQFAKSVSAKKLYCGPKDMNRLNDGYESINSAYTKYGKDQLKEVDRIREDFLTTEDVRNKLLEYVDKDDLSKTEFIYRSTKAALTPSIYSPADQFAVHKVRMMNIRKRIKKMSDADLKVFIRLMQERSVLDVSCIDDGKGPMYVDQEKRIALIEALSSNAETRTSVLTGFDDNESCYKALVNALSFQLRDDINFTGKDLTKDCYAGKSLERKTFTDWDLIERAFSLMDEIKESQYSIYALSHASDYIKESGNVEAIKENRKLERSYKKKSDFTQELFEKYIVQEAKLDGDDDNNAVIAGYNMLSDKEKNLFFKVLARRDLLDISKKDYKKNFFGLVERNYVNQAERDQLIDRYISSSIGDNVGITIGTDAYYDALKTLFSTQIDDTQKFGSTKNISRMVASEKNLFFGRSTAIDWKLFKRALNFVNRASEELEYTEGNAELYRAAGNLEENGMINMDYKFLRRNFHRTGNQWGRYLGRLASRSVKEAIGEDNLDKLVTTLNFVSSMSGIMLSKNSNIKKGIKWLTKEAKTGLDTFVNSGSKLDSEFKVTALDVEEEEDEEEKAKAKRKEKKRRENLTYYQHLKEGLDGVIAQSKSVEGAVADIAKYLRDNVGGQIAEAESTLLFLTETKDIKAKADKKNLVEVKTKDAPKDDSYGDIRDPYYKTKSVINKGIKKYKLTKKIGKSFAPTKELTLLMSYSVENAIKKFIANDVLQQGVEKINSSGLEVVKRKKKQGKAYQKAIDDVVSDVFQEVFESVVGKDTAKMLLEKEETYYNIKNDIGKQIKMGLKSINYAKKCVAHVENIVKSVQNTNMLYDVSKEAKSKRDQDNDTLKKAKDSNRLSEEQSEKVKNTVDKHRGLGEMSKQISVAIQQFNVAEETINFAMETANMFGGKLNAGQQVVSKCIKDGLEFLMFAMKVASDRNALGDYFINTDAGKNMLDNIQKGITKSNDDELEKRFKRSISIQKKVGAGNLVDIISNVRGYEHTNELMENTVMSMAQSIVFCASNYNPMIETRLMAVTVMSILGLEKEIGDTSSETVEKVFNGFKVKR
ncbi:MAG: hypothetical protein K5877_12735 [Lachnospiraceae bacterium]|nr:hypothetical protein [Lachnospiraceae bacterium]